MICDENERFLKDTVIEETGDTLFSDLAKSRILRLLIHGYSCDSAPFRYQRIGS